MALLVSVLKNTSETPDSRMKVSKEGIVLIVNAVSLRKSSLQNTRDNVKHNICRLLSPNQMLTCLCFYFCWKVCLAFCDFCMT